MLGVHQPLRWGIAGCGKIGQDFAAVLSLVPGARLTAVATAASEERAQASAPHALCMRDPMLGAHAPIYPKYPLCVPEYCEMKAQVAGGFF